MTIDLKKEQQASLSRPRYKYSLAAKAFFSFMDIITGKRTTLGKTKMVEILASIPYRSWEITKYGQMTRKYQNWQEVKRANDVLQWGRDAQDNEYWHLLVINEKMKEDGIKDPWYLSWPIPCIMTMGYIVITRIMAFVNIKRAFLFNAEFEDHAEHIYAQFVADNPQWENEPVKSELVKQYGDFENWADVFRRIGLDERDHMNQSFINCGKSENVVQYEK